jgi:hypothetical protein
MFSALKGYFYFMNKLLFFWLLFLYLCIVSCHRKSSDILSTDVLIIGGGASGTTAGIQAARMGVNVTILEETPWLGGMLTSAGVSAIDGNYKLYSGLWEEFRQKIYQHYGGAEQVKTGWVSNVLFEPHVGAGILDSMTLNLKNLSIFREAVVQEITESQNGWIVMFNQDNKTYNIAARIVIDATELGDILKRAGISYEIGMDSRYDTGEDIAPESSNDIIQDLTYVAILKDYGDSADMTINEPANYNPGLFRCTCKGFCDPDSINRTLWDCHTMMNYGRLPNNYYMINWPIFGNDYYANIIEMGAAERKTVLQKAKEHTLCYVYYLQNELGFRNLGIANDIFPTTDRLPFIPYHRESRRMHGLVRFTINDLARPYEQEMSLYRTGIAVGDYPVDHHHAAYPDYENLPDLHFYPVPSYTIPLGSLIPADQDFFIVAEKSISVTNLVNGTTRLQPVCLLIGQAAGTLGALAVQEGTTPKNISVRKVQRKLLESGVYILPYSDITPEDPTFNALQRIGATGILRGDGKNIGWENHTYIHPDSILTGKALYAGLKGWLDVENINISNEDPITCEEALLIIKKIGTEYIAIDPDVSINQLIEESQKICEYYELIFPPLDDTIDRKTFAVLLDILVDPFSIREVDHRGNFIQ